MNASTDLYSSAITSKELNYLSDHVKNEALLTQLCTQAAVECSNPQLKGFFARLAEERCQELGTLTDTLQKYAGIVARH